MSTRDETEEQVLPEPPAAEVIDALYARMNEGGMRDLIGQCLRAVPRVRAVDLVNTYLPTVKLGISADRGRMVRLLTEGVERRRPQVLEALQAIARDPFELKAPDDTKDGLDAAIEELNRARAEAAQGERRKRAAREVATLVKGALEPDEARRLLLLNAFPDVLDDMLGVLDDV